tara:strand:- start:734 stop:1096 length:363 start_codon:yes stop_codon:yes gene_type:complete
MNKIYYNQLSLYLISLLLFGCNSSPYINGKWKNINDSSIIIFNTNGTYIIKDLVREIEKETGTYKLKIRNSSKGDIITFVVKENNKKNKKYSKKVRLKKTFLELGNIYDEKWTSKFNSVK